MEPKTSQTQTITKQPTLVNDTDLEMAKYLAINRLENELQESIHTGIACCLQPAFSTYDDILVRRNELRTQMNKMMFDWTTTAEAEKPSIPREEFYDFFSNQSVYMVPPPDTHF